MQTYITVIASTLLLAPAVTELSSRIWPNNYWALLLLVAAALLLNGFFAARLAPAQQPATQPSRADRQKPQNNKPKRQRDKSASQAPSSSKKAVTGTQQAAAGGDEEGTVKWFNRSKGYGFIVRANGEEIFVHQRSIIRQGEQRAVLRDGQKVKFSVAKRDKGVQAEQVVAVN